MRESKIEKYLKDECEKRNILCYKFVSPAHNGVPDRILIGNGVVVFVETKAPGEVPRKLQEFQHKRIKSHGIDTYVLDTTEKVDDFFLTTNPFKSKHTQKSGKITPIDAILKKG